MQPLPLFTLIIFHALRHWYYVIATYCHYAAIDASLFIDSFDIFLLLPHWFFFLSLAITYTLIRLIDYYHIIVIFFAFIIYIRHFFAFRLRHYYTLFSPLRHFIIDYHYADYAILDITPCHYHATLLPDCRYVRIGFHRHYCYYCPLIDDVAISLRWYFDYHYYCHWYYDIDADYAIMIDIDASCRLFIADFRCCWY